MPRCCIEVDIKCRLINEVRVKHLVYYYFFTFTNTLQSLEINIKANNSRYLYYYYPITSTIRRTFFTYLQPEN
jgi:hypothetical protein